MFRLDSSCNIPSPIKYDLNSAQTEHLYSQQTFSEIQTIDPCDISPLKNKIKEKRANGKVKNKISKTKSNANFQKTLHSQLKNHKSFCKYSRKSTVFLQNKHLSSESFEKVLKINETAMHEQAIVNSSGSKEEKNSNCEHFKFEKNEIIAEKYKILTHIADGTFGRLVKVRSLIDHKIYAMKIIKPVKKYIESAKEEAKTLSYVKEKDKENKFHVIQLIDSFEFKNTFFMVFEKLGASLFDLLRVNNFIGYPMKLLQSVIRQTLISLSFLHSLKLVHTDLKPENILFVSHKTSKVDISHINLPNSFNGHDFDTLSNASSFTSLSEENEIYYYPENDQIKIIDFGGATFDYGLHSRIINTRQYRAPEVILGCCEWSNSSDVWSLGCIIVELYTGRLLFDTHDSYEHLALMEKFTDNIPFWMANRCESVWEKHFILEDDYFEQNKTYFDFVKNCSDLKMLCKIKSMKRIDEIFHPDDYLLKDLVKKMLCINPKKRISCQEALNHEFFKTLYSDLC